MLQLVIHDRFGKPLGDMHGAKNISRSFTLNHAGLLTYDIGLSHPKCNNALIEHGHVLVAYSDETGPWAGYITSLEWDIGADLLHVGAVGMLQRLGKARLTPAKIVGFAHEQVKYVVNDANFEEHKGIYLGNLYTGGESLTIEYANENNYDRLTSLMDQTSYELALVMENPGVFVLNVGEKLGRDLTTSVQLISGIDMDGGGNYREDSQTYQNVITAVGKVPEGNTSSTPEDEWNRRPKAYYQNQSKPKTLNIDNFGRSEEIIEYPDIDDLTTLNKLAKEEGLKRELPQRPVTFTLNTKRGKWSQFEDGDIVALYIPKARFTGLAVPFRVLGREISEDSRLMTVTGDVVAGEAAQNLAMYKTTQYGTNTL